MNYILALSVIYEKSRNIFLTGQTNNKSEIEILRDLLCNHVCKFSSYIRTICNERQQKNVGL